MHRLIFFTVGIFVSLSSAQQHHPFASTKFDLDPSLPFEEPVQVTPPSNDQPKKPPAEPKQPPKKHHNTRPVEAIPTAPQSLPSAQANASPDAQTPAPLAPLRTLAPISAPAAFTPFSVSHPIGSVFTPFTLPPPPPAFGAAQATGAAQAPSPAFPQQPPPQQAGQFAPGPFQAPSAPSPQFPSQPQFGQFPGGFQPRPQQQQFTGFQQPQQPQQQGGFGGQQPQQQQQFTGFQSQQPQQQQGGFGGQGPQQNGAQQFGQPTHQVQPQQRVQVVRAGPERIDLWFREDYDINVCKRDARYLANEFRLKFPSHLWQNGKETLLADLLSARLNDCFTKQESNHWRRVDGLITSLRLPSTEEEECRTGLIQEQISCDNVFSYTCQFIQKAYNFRLVPTRIIIHEARIAEDGAEKCRKIVRKIKKELQQG